jgi:hypothetical protein
MVWPLTGRLMLSPTKTSYPLPDRTATPARKLRRWLTGDLAAGVIRALGKTIRLRDKDHRKFGARPQTRQASRHASIRKALLQKCRRARERMKEGASKSARSGVALTAARYCCAPTVSRFNLLRQVQRAANSIAVGFQQVSSIFSFGLRKMCMFVEHSARAKPVEVELPQLNANNHRSCRMSQLLQTCRLRRRYDRSLL